MLSKYCFFHKTDSNQYIVFNSLLFEPIVIEEKEYLDLRDDNLKVFSDEELALLKQKGIIVQDDNTDNLALSKLKQHVNSAIQGGISLIYIIPSNICNLACKYCFIGQLNQSKIEISTEIIDKIISEYYNHLIKAMSQQTVDK